MNRKQYTQFSKKMVMAVVLSEIAMCIATIVLACCGFDMAIGVEVIKANAPFAVVAFAAYSGNSAVEKWASRSARSEGYASDDESDGSNG
ncbi:MAG: hypothetical protein J1E43_08195 [Christensenellaceae bacterium]|nr:hypothetical protein [Christensenellaceae bacterium]